MLDEFRPRMMIIPRTAPSTFSPCLQQTKKIREAVKRDIISGKGQGRQQLISFDIDPNFSFKVVTIVTCRKHSRVCPMIR